MNPFEMCGFVTYDLWNVLKDLSSDLVSSSARGTLRHLRGSVGGHAHGCGKIHSEPILSENFIR